MQAIGIEQTISSLEVAEMVGREHKNVMRDIEKIKQDLGQLKVEHTPYFVEATYTHPQNKQQYPMYSLTKQGCELYGNRMTGIDGTAFSVKYITHFNKMELELKQQLPEDPIQLALAAALDTRRKVQAMESDVRYLKNTMRIDGVEQMQIKDLGNKMALNALAGTESTAYQNRPLRSKVFIAMWREFKQYFSVPRYSELPKARMQEAIEFLNGWRPSRALEMEIQVENQQQQLF